MSKMPGAPKREAQDARGMVVRLAIPCVFLAILLGVFFFWHGWPPFV